MDALQAYLILHVVGTLITMIHYKIDDGHVTGKGLVSSVLFGSIGGLGVIVKLLIIGGVMLAGLKFWNKKLF